jgi:uncharacterized membrane protein YtjA (UPF0391 family)
MIKKLKLQKAVIVFILGIIALVVYKVMSLRELDASVYALEIAGVLFMLGALMFIYPILFARKDKGGKVQLDPDKPVVDEVEK